ncbi:Kef-type potassium/proton antiporter, CPA2 family [Magnetococcus marinus MC-1]|uniref:Kef-type potassium/proton antiporter, CPA2 family n=1 Tax=Magnetococcus marinus (strain ATCC BAA-1437 / JCM 17883 / MC-1) TaxID=156889 RepID=A0LD77_MAGMM|nr:cation:proton antiporter [Magnetococcus marinus]ABK45920.1 Kef-type potassium/proton antiporter, CPA2 family [Magnetococcus marinus MC-1]
MHDGILLELLIIFALSVSVVYLCHRLGIAPIIGFLLTGAVAGPFGLTLIDSIEQVELLAEIGVMLLLFTIGMELSLTKLVEMQRAVFVGGGLQVGLTVAVGALLAVALGFPLNQSLFFGFLLAHSSTAIVLKTLQSRGEVGSAHGGAAVGVLIFQDLIVVPMLLLVPLLAGKAENPMLEMGLFSLKFVGIGFALWFGARRLIPAMLNAIVRLRDPELFLLFIIAIGLGIAWLTAAAGLSLALGAFLAGLIISESEYGHQAFASVLPFRDVFTSLFFISVGMLMDVGFLWNHLGLILTLTLLAILCKALLTSGAVLSAGIGFAAAAGAGLTLAQIGEFAFVLARSGVDEGLLSQQAYQTFLAVSVLTMSMTPLLAGRAGRWGRKLAHMPLFRRLALGAEAANPTKDTLHNHLIIIGFGENGHTMAQLARYHGIDHLILETNPETVRREKLAGAHIQFGDASRASILKHAGIDHAKALLITVPDAAATRHILHTARHLRADLPIIARTSFKNEVEALETLGATHVVAMQLEASVVLCQHTLRHLEIPQEQILLDLDDIRHHRLPGATHPPEAPQPPAHG